MIYRPRTRLRVGTAAAAATLVVHGLFTLLLMLEDRDLLRPLPSARKLVGMWIHLPPIPQPEPEPIVEPAVVPPPDRPAVARPARAITLAPASDAPDAPESATAPPAPASNEPRPWTDWELEAQKLAARRERDPENFSGPLQAMREPCKPHQSSMWPKKPAQEDAPPWREPGAPPKGSVMMGGTRVGVVGIGIPIGGPKPEPNKHLFDDMMAGKTPRSSVPDPNVCD